MFNFEFTCIKSLRFRLDDVKLSAHVVYVIEQKESLVNSYYILITSE